MLLLCCVLQSADSTGPSAPPLKSSEDSPGWTDYSRPHPENPRGPGYDVFEGELYPASKPRDEQYDRREAARYAGYPAGVQHEEGRKPYSYGVRGSEQYKDASGGTGGYGDDEQYDLRPYGDTGDRGGRGGGYYGVPPVGVRAGDGVEGMSDTQRQAWEAQRAWKEAQQDMEQELERKEAEKRERERRQAKKGQGPNWEKMLGGLFGANMPAYAGAAPDL